MLPISLLLGCAGIGSCSPQVKDGPETSGPPAEADSGPDSQSPGSEGDSEVDSDAGESGSDGGQRRPEDTGPFALFDLGPTLQFNVEYLAVQYAATGVAGVCEQPGRMWFVPGNSDAVGHLAIPFEGDPTGDHQVGDRLSWQDGHGKAGVSTDNVSFYVSAAGENWLAETGTITIHLDEASAAATVSLADIVFRQDPKTEYSASANVEVAVSCAVLSDEPIPDTAGTTTSCVWTTDEPPYSNKECIKFTAAYPSDSLH